MKPLKPLKQMLTMMVMVASLGALHAAGTLKPAGSPEQDIQIRTHHLDVVINNGFSRTEVSQTFFNPNSVELEAIYQFPVPKGAALSEVELEIGEETLKGEVLEKKEAEKVYEEEKNKGNDAGLAEKDSFKYFRVKVARIKPSSEVKARFVYYQSLEIDTGMGRYLYPLEDGGVDEVAASFWTANEKVENSFSANIVLKSAVPVDDVRLTGATVAPTIQKMGVGHYQATVSAPNGSLNKDLVFYYRLNRDLPGRVDVIPYRGATDQPGTFMAVITPGTDLKPVNTGADYVFVLDVSGSMRGKIQTLAEGVSKAIKQMNPQDRFRVVLFESSARELIGWKNATPDNVAKALKTIKAIGPEGSTNLYQGLSLGLKKTDQDRVTSLILVTDGVTNTGVIAPQAFDKLMRKQDIRVFGFLLGNSANWPLMRVVCEASGGFYAGVSNTDDIVGQLMMAKSKITHEAMHDAKLTVKGGGVMDLGRTNLGKVYRGQQLVLFGRYDKPGQKTLELKVKIAGETKTYATTFTLPELARENPELERLWALNRIERTQLQQDIGLLPESEGKPIIRDLGITYQLVTDYTSMVILRDDTFARRGIERRNLKRSDIERQARTLRSQQPLTNYRVDSSKPTFSHRAPHISRPSRGGGAIDPISGILFALMAGLGLTTFKRRDS